MSSKRQLAAGNPQLADLKKITVIWVLAGWVLSFVAQINYDAWRRYSPPKLTGVDYNVYIEPQPLSPPLATAVSFGATEFLADYYWLTLIQYYGGGTPSGRYRKLAELFNVVTDLSPKFQQAYQTGLIILPGEGFVDEAIALGQKGKTRLPDSWELPYYTGLVYHIYKKDYVNAAKEFQVAAAINGAPPITKLFVGIYYNLADQRRIAYEIFRTVYETSADSFVKERAGKYLLHSEIAFFLEGAVKKYQDRFGRFPAALADLVGSGIITAVPESPLGIKFSINPQTGAVAELKTPKS